MLQRFSALLALTFAAACGGNDPVPPAITCGAGTVAKGNTCVVDEKKLDDELRPKVDSIKIKTLEVIEEGEHPFYVLHPIDVTGTLEILAESFQADLLVGLQSPDGAVGCTIGTVPLKYERPFGPNAGVAQTVKFAEEFVLPGTCFELAGRKDVQVFLAFDPWARVILAGRSLEIPARPKVTTSFFDFAKHFELKFGADCVANAHGPHPTTCASALDLRASPGRDVELTRVDLATSVAVLEVPLGEEPAETVREELHANALDGLPVPTNLTEAQLNAVHPAVKAKVATTPNFEVTVDFRTLGVDESEKVAAGDVHLKMAVRPLEGGVGTSTLRGEHDFDWEPLEEEEDVLVDGAVTREFKEDVELEQAEGSNEHGVKEVVEILGEAKRRMLTGAWAKVNEFELEVCLAAKFDEAKFDGEGAPRRNNCAILPVIVLREEVTPDGPLEVDDGGSLNEGAWTQDKTYSQIWGSMGTASAGFDAWLTTGFNGQDASAAFGLGGSALGAKGGWYEAGSKAAICLFGACVDVARAIVTLKDYQATTDQVEVEGKILLWHFFPKVTFNWPDGELELGEVIELANQVARKDYATTKSFEKEIVGKKFGTSCGGATASISAFVEMGLDDEGTKIGKEALEPSDPSCEGSTVNNELCFKPGNVDEYDTVDGLDKRCKEAYGEEASGAFLRDATDLALARDVAGDGRWFVIGNVYSPGRRGSTFYGNTDGFATGPLQTWADGSPNPGPAATPSPACGEDPNERGLTLACPAGQVILSVEQSFYGTPNGSCSTALSAGSCNSSVVLDRVRARCVGNNACTFAAPNREFGDPCGGTRKRFITKLMCGSPTAKSLCVEPALGSESPSSFTCPAGTVISSIDDAYYGTPGGSCSAGFSRAETCDASTVRELLRSRCLGKASCSFGAPNAEFGDPCPNVAKRFVANLECVKPGEQSLRSIHVTPDNQLWTGAMDALTADGVCSVRSRPGTTGGSKITATVQPFIAVGAIGALGIDFSFVNFSLELTLNILELAMPFEGTLTGRFRTDGRVSLELGRKITLELTALSGQIVARISWENFWDDGSYTVVLTKWEGFKLGEWDVLPEVVTTRQL